MSYRVDRLYAGRQNNRYGRVYRCHIGRYRTPAASANAAANNRDRLPDRDGWILAALQVDDGHDGMRCDAW